MLTVNPSNNSGGGISGKSEYLNIFDFFKIVKKYRNIVFLTPLAFAVVAAGVSLLLPNIYTASAKILPPQSQSGASQLLGQLGGLGGLAGAAVGGKITGETYVGMLGSRTVGDNLVQRFNLLEIYKADFKSDARKTLKKATTITNGRDGIIVIDVDDKNPERAALLANGYVQELQKLTESLAITEASRRRLFLEKRLGESKKALNESELELKNIQEKTGLIKLDGQAQATISAIAMIKSQIAAKEVALAAMRTFATAENPIYIQNRQEINGLKAQLDKVERGTNQGNGDISISTEKLPSLGMEYIRKVRDVKYNELLFENLAKQFEIARIDEARDSSMIQVLDDAVIPDKKSKPTRSILVLIFLMLGGVFGLVWAFSKEAFAQAGNPFLKNNE
ncbi:hypothetical protein CNX70_26985 [Janthinobacterium svalbardensis]|uniref:Lipopolysaccharide biosynthesis protein n=1 Tax=Janthinobacterium svalbardensis TaxID=368607 RepID=A0A290X343_9BURK|nr:GNVR domain-containing protein [Janthinobacterium svalbardensis]ATD63398.1 hypothetical protein CNX70_26985 [Janthinobacterium svalbardensis]